MWEKDSAKSAMGSRSRDLQHPLRQGGKGLNAIARDYPLG